MHKHGTINKRINAYLLIANELRASLYRNTFMMKRGIIMHVQPPVSQVVRLASRLSSETPALGKDRQGMFVE